MGATNKENQKQIEILQNRSVQRITFKNWFFTGQTDSLHKELNLLKFRDFVHLQNGLLMSQIEPNGKLSKFFSTLKHCGYNLSYNARLAAKKLLDLLLLNIETYGTQSTKCNCVID